MQQQDAPHLIITE